MEHCILVSDDAECFPARIPCTVHRVAQCTILVGTIWNSRLVSESASQT